MHDRERGFASFFAALLVFSAIALIMLAVGAQSAMKLRQSVEEDSAAQLLNRIGSAELVSQQLYGEALPPSGLTGSLANPISCTNPMLVDGQDAQPDTEGYALAWTGDNTIAGVGTCPIGSKLFTLTATPVSFAGKRYFFLDQSGVVRFSDGSPATSSSPVYTIAAPHQTTSTILTMVGSTAPNNPPPPPTTSVSGNSANEDFGGSQGPYSAPFLGNSVAWTIANATCASGCSELGTTKTITSWSVTITPSNGRVGFNGNEKYTFNLCDASFVSGCGTQNIVGAWPVPYSSLSCTISPQSQAASASCTQTTPNLVIDATDSLQVEAWNDTFGQGGGTLIANWTLNFSN